MDILKRASRGKHLVIWCGLLATFAAGCSNSTPTPTNPACTYTLSNANVSSSATGGDSAVTVTTTSGCSWSASTNASWIHIASVSSTSGNGVVNFTVDSNAGASRTGTLTVANQTVTVTQAAGSPQPPPPQPQCTFTLSIGSSIDGYPSGGTFTVGVMTQTACSWTASTTASWIHIAGAPGTSGGSFAGVGSGSFIFTVDPNYTASNRTGTLSIAGLAVTFNQSSSP